MGCKYHGPMGEARVGWPYMPMGQLMNRMGLEKGRPLTTCPFPCPLPTSVYRPSQCNLTCGGGFTGLHSVHLSSNTSSSVPGTNVSFPLNQSLEQNKWDAVPALETRDQWVLLGIMDWNRWLCGEGWGRRALCLVRTQGKKEVSSQIRPPGDSAKTSWRKWLSWGYKTGAVF